MVCSTINSKVYLKMLGIDAPKYFIKSLKNFQILYERLQKTGLSPSILDKISLIDIPKEKMNEFSQEYLDNNNSKEFDFSRDDYLLARFSAESNYPAISYDHHLLLTIPQILDYEPCSPDSVFEDDPYFHADFYLLDTNVLIYLLEETDSWKKEEIKSMFKRIPDGRFLITWHIIEEYEHVIQKLENMSENEGKGEFPNTRTRSNKILHRARNNWMINDEFKYILDDYMNVDLDELNYQ